MSNWLRALIFIAVGLALGLGAGLVLGWVVWPLEITSTDPTILRDDYRLDYTLMIADTYALDGDLTAAEARLRNVDPADPSGWMLSLTVDHILAGRDETEIRHLVGLATALDLYSPAMEPYLPTPESDVSQ